MLIDDLASSLQRIVNSLNGWSGCSTIRALAADAEEVLVRYAAEKEHQRQSCQQWAREAQPELWEQWLGAGLVPFEEWLAEFHGEVRGEYRESLSASSGPAQS